MSKELAKRVKEVLRRLGRDSISYKDLAIKAEVKKSETKEFAAHMEELKQSGVVVEQKQKYIYSKNYGYIPATVVKINGTFGFVRPVDYENDMFVPGRFLMGAMPGDTVLIRKQRGRGELEEAAVVAILTQSQSVFTGVLTKKDRVCEVMPDSMVRFGLRVAPSSVLGAKDGDKVLATIITRGDRHFDHIAKVLQVFGSAQSADACCDAIITARGVVPAFPREVQAQAEVLAEKEISPRELAKREDFRFQKIFTIDSADSKDLDDAISLEKTDNGWVLGVHIADVSHYVRANTELDEEAYTRGTSIYYGDHVIPMLPPELSNGICSLNPGEDRLAFSAVMTLDQNGDMQEFAFHKSVIRSRVKGVYAEINQILSGEADGQLREKYVGLEEMIRQMKELSDLLERRKKERGCVDLESTESKIVFDENHVAINVLPRKQGIAEGMIENFMLMANQAAATFAIQRELPFIYRVHDNPTPEKLENLAELLRALGQDAREIHPPIQPMAFAHVLDKVRGTPQALSVNNQLLRSMAKAIYSEKNIGHFGLVLKNYAHFTSPIRRYPDLCVHRILSDALLGNDAAKTKQKFHTFVAPCAVHSSETEQRAMTIERDCADCYKAEVMSNHIGEEFDGIVSSVTSFGMYVLLESSVEGMVRVADMTGDYEHDGKVSLRSLTGGISYTVGDKVHIKVLGASVSSGKVDFALV